MGLKLRKRNRYKKVPTAYQYMPWNGPDQDIPATYDDDERPSYMGTNVMFPVEVSAKTPEYQENPYIQNPESISSGIDYKDYDEKYQPRQTTGDLAFAMKTPHEKGLEIVSPEFDALTLGMGIRDLWNLGKSAYALSKATKSYTGVPRYILNASKAAPNRDFYVFTTSNKDVANTYSTGIARANASNGGRIFNVYAPKNLNVLTLEKPASGKVYMDRKLPFDFDRTTNRIIKRTNTGEHVFNNAYGTPYQKTIHVETSIAQPTSGMSPVGRTNDLAEILKHNTNFDGVEIPDIVDGTYRELYYDTKTGTMLSANIAPSMTERIYFYPSKLIFSPENEPIYITAFKNAGTNFGGITSFGTGLTRYGFNNND